MCTIMYSFTKRRSGIICFECNATGRNVYKIVFHFSKQYLLDIFLGMRKMTHNVKQN